MINIEFSKAGEHLSLEMKGHAEYSHVGSDIVCAAVSGIFYALLGYVKNECGELTIHRLASGDAFIECSLDAEAAMKLSYIGFLQIGLTYPDTIKIEDGLWGKRAAQAREAKAV